MIEINTRKLSGDAHPSYEKIDPSAHENSRRRSRSNPISSIGDLAYTTGGAVAAAGKPIARNLAEGSGEEYNAIFTRSKDHVVAELTTVQFSAELDIWVNNTEPPAVLTGADGANPAAVEAVSVPYPLLISMNGASKKPTFFRVVVTLNP